MKVLDPKKAVVLFSGGQDSTTCLGWACKKWGKENVLALGFNYGQRHDVELKVAQEIAKDLGVDYKILKVDFSEVSKSALLDKSRSVNDTCDNLPASFVPGRNIFFLNYASVLAYQLGYKNIVTGVCQTDFSGYPDCRDNFVKATQVSLSLGLEAEIMIHTPLMSLTKAQTWALAQSVECVLLVKLSHTCYNGVREVQYEWGFGCGECPACQLRRKGYEEWKSGNY